MASRNPNRPGKQPAKSVPRPSISSEPPEVVEPMWLVKALGLTIAAALLLGYLSVCFLVYQGGWQFLLHPIAKVDATPGVAFDLVHFDSAATGRPRLTAWWIPAPSMPSTAPTLLYLHDGSGSLAASAKRLDLLHGAGVNIFAIDYRGFGQSEGPHPNELRMQEDAAAALDYLLNTRHLAPEHVIPYGRGLGAVMAATLTAEHPELAALIVDSPDPEAFARVTSTGETRLLPMRLLVQEHFDIVRPLTATHQPKLLLTHGGDTTKNQELFRSAPAPKMVVTLAAEDPAPAELAALSSFLSKYVPSAKR
jgi:pimeloyl-ACP methyl ester carboxylesterase